MKRGEASIKHGQSRDGVRSKEYTAWQSMRQRCYNENTKSYRDYGAKGVRVAAVWLKDFQAFFDHIGKAPSSRHTVDRIDNTRGYEPGNVRWATRKEQSVNRQRAYGRGESNSRAKLSTQDVVAIRNRHAAGESKKDLAYLYGVSRAHINHIVLRRGWKHA